MREPKGQGDMTKVKPGGEGNGIGEWSKGQRERSMGEEKETRERARVRGRQVRETRRQEQETWMSRGEDGGRSCC